MKFNKIAKTSLLAAIAIMMLQSPAEAQNLHVKGIVVDNKSGEAMPFVNVAVVRSTDTVFLRGETTGFDGRFDIEGIDTGSYLLQASFVGYETYLKPLELLDNLDNMEIRLTGGTTLQEVSVVADKPLYAMDGEKNMYNTKEDPSIQTGTASDALQNAPGVEVDAEGNITLRGVSSVEIWVNDRPSHMNEEALKQYIKQMPANAIERIEVITNPSARYSTSGGVINIVTNQVVKRNELLCVGVRAYTKPSILPWVSYVWANEKFDMNIYLNADYSKHNMKANGTSTLLDTYGDTSRYQEYRSSTKATNEGGYTGFNFNWKIDDKTNLSTWMGAYPYWGNNSSQIAFHYFEYPSPVDLGYNYTMNNGDGFGWGGYLGSWLEHRFDTTGRKLSISLNGNTWSNSGTSEETFAYYDPLRNSLHRRTSTRQVSPGISMEVNYTHPMKHDLELNAGGEIGYNYNINEQEVDSLLASGDWDVMGLRGYRSEATGWSPAAYVTLQKRWGTFTAKLGLRGEGNYETGTLQHISDASPIAIDTFFFGLVPSLHLTYRTKDFQNYSFSYTRRFSDPNDLADLCNFRVYDDYSFRTGNPNLLRSYTHNLEAGWNKFLMGFGMVGLNAYWRANTNERGTMTAATTDPYYGTLLVNYTYPDNIGSSHTEGLDINLTYRPTGFFNVRLDASVFNYGYDYQGFDTSKVSYRLRVNLWAKLWNKLEVFVNAHYSCPRLGLYSMSVANKGMDFGVSSDFFDRQLSIYLNVNDIFGWTQWGDNTMAPQYRTTGSQSYDSRFVSFGITWRIGKMELESKARQGATDNNMPQM